MAIGTEHVVVATCDNDDCGKRHYSKGGQIVGITGTAVVISSDGERTEVEWFSCLTKAPGHVGKAVQGALTRTRGTEHETAAPGVTGESDDDGWDAELPQPEGVGSFA